MTTIGGGVIISKILEKLGGFRLHNIIEHLIMNAHQIYNLYRMIQKTESKIEKEAQFTCLEYLTQKEEKLLDRLQKDYASHLQDIYFKFLTCYGLSNDSVLENYIVLNNQSLALLRISEKLKKLVRENPITSTIKDEEGEVLLQEKSTINKFYASEEDYILDTISQDLELEICLRFMNISATQKPREKVLKEKVAFIPYEITYLNSLLEQIYVKDRILNFPNQLYSTKIIYEEVFEENILYREMNEYYINLALQQINYLISERLCRTKQTAFLRGIYLFALLSNLDEEEREDFLVNVREEIEEIPYKFTLVRKLKKEVSKIYITEEIREKEEEQNEKSV